MTRQAQAEEFAKFLGSFAHELKTPLSVVRAYLDLATEDTLFIDNPRPSDKRLATKLAAMAEQLDQTHTLLRDAVRFWRLQHVDVVPCCINEVLSKAIDESLLALAGEAGVRITTMFATQAPMINIDPEPFTLAVFQLIRNAIEASKPGSEVVVRTALKGTGMKIRIRDWGCGIDDVTRFRMFNPYYSTKKNHSGLGLSIALRVLRLHGADICVESTPNLGTAISTSLVGLPRLCHSPRLAAHKSSAT